MTTIPQRLHEIAEQLAVIASSNRGIGLDQAVSVAAIAAELEAPAADAVPVDTEEIASMLWRGDTELLIRQRDHLATVAALQARIKSLEAENFALAAGQCIVPGGLCGDEGGSQYCSLQRAASNAKTPP